MKVMKGKLNNISGFVLMSDGSEASLYNKKNKSLAPALKRVMCQMEIIDSMYIQNKLQNSFDTVIRNATVDDCSIAIIVKQNLKGESFEKLSLDNRCLLLGIDKRNIKTIKKIDAIMEYLFEPRDMISISKKTYIKPKYLRKYLLLLENSNMIVKENNRYVSVYNTYIGAQNAIV